MANEVGRRTVPSEQERLEGEERREADMRLVKRGR